MDERTLAERIHDCLHNPVSFRAKVVNGVIGFLIIASLATLPLHFLDAAAWFQPALKVFDKITVSLFTIEYFLRIWSAKNAWKYVFSWWGLVDLLAILPFYLAIGGVIKSPELFLLLRTLRIFKLAKILEGERTNIAKCAKDRHGKFKVIGGEIIELVVQKHPVVFLGAMIPPLFCFGFGMLILVFFLQDFLWATLFIVGIFMFFAFLLFLKAWLDFNYDVIYVTNKRIILQRRELFGSVINSVAYEAITNIRPDNTGVINWILKNGDIRIETAAAEGTLLFEDALKPYKVIHKISEIRQQVLEKRSSESIIRAQTKI